MFFKKKSRVICVGSSSQDVFFPISGLEVIDTPEDLTAQKKILLELGGKYKCEDRFEAVGGVAANVAQGLARLGVRSSLYSKVGDDDLGKWIIRSLENENVSTDLIEIANSIKSDLSAVIVLEETGERTIIHNRDANEQLEIVSDRFSGMEWLFISSLNGEWKNNLRLLLNIARESGAKIAFNPGQHNLRDDPNLVAEVIGAAALLILNKDEAIELVLKKCVSATFDRDRLNDEVFLLEKLHNLGGKVIALTDGIRGAWASDRTKIVFCKPVLREGERAVDTTGAGDAFTSAFLAAWIDSANIETAVRWGIGNGVNVTRYYGACKGLLRKDEINKATAQLVVEVL